MDGNYPLALVAANAGSLLRSQNLLDLSVQSIWLSSALLALVVFVITYRPRAWAGYVLGGVLVFSLVWHVNPVIVRPRRSPGECDLEDHAS